MAKQNANKWKEMTDAEKASYLKLAEQDQLRYKNEMTEFKEKGFFINQDGENSKDLFLREQKKQTEAKPRKKFTAFFFFNLET